MNINFLGFLIVANWRGKKMTETAIMRGDEGLVFVSPRWKYVVNLVCNKLS